MRVRLQEQPFQVLLALVEHPQQVVTRNDLKKRLWPADTYVDFDQGLNRAVAKLREALDDPAEQPVYIQTLARRGYRFLAPVDWVQAPTDLIQRHHVKRNATIWAASIISILAIAITLLLLRIWQPKASAQYRIRSIAVLPLENVSGDPQQEYLADGMTDELITQLARFNGLSVTSRTSVMSYKGRRHVATPQIAKALGVDAIIEGTVMRSGDRVRITVQLIDASTDRHLWAQSYEQPFTNIIGLQDSIANEVAEQMHGNLAKAPAHPLQTNSTAYDAYLRGRSYVFAGFDTPQALRRAQSYFQDSIQFDPNFARGYSGLAESYVLLSEFRWLAPDDAYRPAKDAISKALQLDPSLGEAHMALAWLTWRHDWDWTTAEKEYRYACELSPNDVDAHQALTWFLAWRGRKLEALAEIRKILQLDPVQASAIDDAGVFYHQRDYKSLIKAGQRAVASRPDFWVSHYFLGVGYEGAGQLSSAISEYQKAFEMSQGDTDPASLLAHAYAVSGRTAEAKQLLHNLQETAQKTYVSPYMIAGIYAGLNDKENAFHLLERAYTERSTDLPYFLKADLRMDQLRTDPRFQDLLYRVKLPD